MALRNRDPFAEIAANLTSEKNPYLRYFRANPDESDLPISYGPYLKSRKDRWRALFPNPDAPLCLEVGCHLGKTLCEMAERHPEINFIGIDITFKRVATAAKRAVSRNLPNIHTALVNAVFLDQIFGSGELDGMFVFFPDPWTKSRKAKHRLVKPDFARKVRDCLKAGGFFWLKTDQRPYFDDACEYLLASGFTPVTEPHGLLSETYETTFERKFNQMGLPSYSRQWTCPR